MPPRTRRHRASRRDAVRLFTRTLLALPVVIGIGVMVWLGFFATPSSERMLERFRMKPGAPVPYVQLQDRAGGSVTLAAAATGQPTLVLISDADCTHCETQLRMLKQLDGGTQPAGARVMGVSVSVEGRYKSMAARYAPIPLYDDVNGAIRGKLGLEVVPAVVSVGADGTVRDVRVGLQNPSQLRALMEAAASPVRLSAATAPAR